MFLLPDHLNSVSELKPSWSRKPLLEKNRPSIKSSRCVFDIFFQHYPDIDMYESFWVMLLSRGNRLKAISNISIGSLSGTVADPKKIFQMALLANASSIVLIHNHPSGNLNPSKMDMDITKKCKSAGDFLDISVIDHIIFSPFDSYFSFADETIL